MKRDIFIFFSMLILLISCDKEDINGYSNGSYYNDFGAVPYAGERYNDFEENPFVQVADQSVSTFSIDADGASYSNVRRFLSSNTIPPKGAIRTEELINYFTFNYPDDGTPITVHGEVSECPWNTANKLIRIGIKGKTVPREELPASNIVFLIDVSGSMSAENKLPLLKSSFKLFVDQLGANDKVAIVTYAGQAGLALKSTACNQKSIINKAIDKLESGGSTAGAQGIVTAYEIAKQNFITGGNNRVILATDGDFNVGMSNHDELIKLIEGKRADGIFLTVLGVGDGNLNEAMMEQLANNGNGNYEYIDNAEQAKKVFVYDLGKFLTVAKDVKVQVKFAPQKVKSYRLIGYENRVLENKDFENDTTDAGEIGSGQTITALYEIEPAENTYHKAAIAFEIDFRYKLPDSDVSNLIEMSVKDNVTSFNDASENMRFAVSVASFGMLLRDSKYKGDLTYGKVKAWATAAKTYNPNRLRDGFIELLNHSLLNK